MKQQLEMLMDSYQPKILRKEETTYTGSQLEYLSASALYGFSDPLSPAGFRHVFGSDPIRRSEPLIRHSNPLRIGNSNPLTIRDFPSSGFQLHIHEQPGGKPLIKGYDGKKIAELSSYDAAIGDLNADKLDLSKYFIPPRYTWKKTEED
jgi:hypothetical protein